MGTVPGWSVTLGGIKTFTTGSTTWPWSSASPERCAMVPPSGKCPGPWWSCNVADRLLGATGLWHRCCQRDQFRCESLRRPSGSKYKTPSGLRFLSSRFRWSILDRRQQAKRALKVWCCATPSPLQMSRLHHGKEPCPRARRQAQRPPSGIADIRPTSFGHTEFRLPAPHN